MGASVLLATLVSALVACFADPAAAQSRSADPRVIERPEWALGDWWELTDSGGTRRLTVVARGSGYYVLVRTAPGTRGYDSPAATKFHAGVDGWITKTVQPDGEVTEAEYNLEWVRFPLSVGKTWSFSAHTPTKTGGKAQFDFYCRAEAWETIRIADRDVRALRIGCQSSHRREASGTTHVVWYAPDAKRVVRLVSQYAGGYVSVWLRLDAAMLWTIEVVAWGGHDGPLPAVARADTPREVSPPAPVPTRPEPPRQPLVEEPPAEPSTASTRQPPRQPLVEEPPLVAAPPTVDLVEPTPPGPSTSTPPLAAPPTDTEAPRIAINYPPPDTRVDRESIVITGLVTDNVEVARVQVAINGVDVAQPRDIAAFGKGVPIRVQVALQPGDNLIEVTAFDKAGNLAQVVRTVTRLGPAVAAPVGPKVASRWAVVIGVGEYEHAQIPRLRFAVRDAEAMYEFLTTQGGYAKEHVVLLTDHTPVKPTLLNIKRALGDFLARRTGRDDMVLIYFAGHGAPEVDVVGAESDGLSKYLVPRDGDPESLYTTALPMDELQRIFARIPAERVVMLLDTCYSGTAGGRTFARTLVRASGLNDQFLERLTRSRGRVIMTASGPNEVALEIANLGHGIFTYYVLEGLGGKADRNGDGIVTVSELYEYVEDQVDKAARLAGGRQRPLMKGEIEGTLPLARTGRR
jgi:hypothetical protein